MGRRLDLWIGNLEAEAVRLQERIVNQQNVNRAGAAGVGAAVAVILIWLIPAQPPAEVVVAITTVVQTITQIVWRRFGIKVGE